MDTLEWLNLTPKLSDIEPGPTSGPCTTPPSKKSEITKRLVNLSCF